MIEKIPQLDLTQSCHSLCNTARSRLGRTPRRDQPDSEVEIWEDDMRLVGMQYFKKKDMFCTVTRQKQHIQVYAKKNSVLLAIWVYILKMPDDRSITMIEENLQEEGLNLEMMTGVPLQFAALNNSKTMKQFLLCVLRTLTNARKVSSYCLQKTLIQMLIDYPFFVYCGVCFVRAKGSTHLKNNFNKYLFDLLGNEQTLFRDYSAELCNMPLELIADSLGLSITLKHDQKTESIGSGKQSINIEKSGNSYLIQIDTELQPAKKFEGSEHFQSTVTSSSHEFEHLPANKICHRCLSVKTGKFCDCRKKKVVNRTVNERQKQEKVDVKKYCKKCEAEFLFVCKCYLDQ